MHRGTIHFNSTMTELEAAYQEAAQGLPATRPVIEMTIPSALDPTVAPVTRGHHVVQLFVQYAPYHLQAGSWDDPLFTAAFADRIFRIVDEFCPGFSASVLHRDVLSPLHLERIFGLPGGSISHGALSLNQLGYARPAPGWADYRTPVGGLYLCSAGTHPGGGVIGAPGRNCSRSVLFDVG
jgi:phytoene dehydrogenase-like protein